MRFVPSSRGPIGKWKYTTPGDTTQRTATVSKMVLTQCNTIISFTCYHETSLGFHKNIYGQSHIELIPNLRPLHAIALGKWVKSEQPIVFEIPYDERKSAV